MGCLFAARLKQAGSDVMLMDHRPERAGVLERQGVHVEGVSGEYTVRVPVTAGAEAGAVRPEFVLICVKSNQTQAAGRAVADLVDRAAVVVTLQNGLGHVETLRTLFGPDRVLGGVTSEGATLLDTGRIRHAGRGETILGPQGEPGGPAERLAEAFNRAGFSTRCLEDVTGVIWGKLIVNVGINALTALTRLRNGRLPEVQGTRRVMARAVAEAAAVAEAKGVALPYPDPFGRVLEVCRGTAENVASMLQDVLKERLTEVDFINGAIVREGEALGVPTPANEVLTNLVQALQETYAERLATP
jgi:2-dehydropantoate 2-reductase